MLNVCNVFSLAVSTLGHKHAILALLIVVLLITAITSGSGSARTGAAVFIVCISAATRC